MPFAIVPFAIIPLLTLLCGSSLASGDPSLRYQTSFGLFWDPWDYLEEPAMLSRQGGRHIYTQLAGMGDSKNLLLGRVGPARQGVWGANLEGGGSSAASSATAENEDTGLQELMESWDRAYQLAGLFSYGRALNDRLALGLRVTAELDQSASSMGCQPWGDFSSDETQVQRLDGEEVYRGSGSYTRRSGRYGLLVGLAQGEGDRWLEMDLRLEYAREVPLAEAELDTGDERYHLQGFHPAEPLESNQSAWNPGLRVDTLSPLHKDLDLRVLGDVQVARGGVSVDESLQTYWSGDRGETLEMAARVKNYTAWWEQAELLGVLHWTRDALALRGGLGVTVEHDSVAYVHTLDDDWGGDTSTSTQVEVTTTDLTLQMPLALELQVHPAWMIRSGAALWLDRGWSEGLETAGSDIASTRWGELRTSTQVSLGLRYEPSPWVTLDAMFRSASDEGRLLSALTGPSPLDLSSVWLSAVLHL